MQYTILWQDHLLERGGSLTRENPHSSGCLSHNEEDEDNEVMDGEEEEEEEEQKEEEQQEEEEEGKGKKGQEEWGCLDGERENDWNKCVCAKICWFKNSMGWQSMVIATGQSVFCRNVRCLQK